MDPRPDFTEPRTSKLAVWSLVLGILGVSCFSIFTGIPAVICGHLGLSKIRDSRGALGGKGLAIAGLVTGYIGILFGLLIFPLLLSIAIPNFVRARNVSMANACLNNLRQLDAAKNQWALEHRKPTGVSPTLDDLKPYLKNGMLPVCPAGGVYTFGAVGADPECSIPGHSLSQFPDARTLPQSISVPTPVASTPKPSASKAIGVFVPALNCVDLVHNPDDNILYITAEDSVLRYQLDSQKFLPPLVLGGLLKGIDISPDHHLLAVADGAGNNGRIGIHLVTLPDGKTSTATFSSEMHESGTYSVAFGADGEIWISSSLSGSGFVPLRKYNPPTKSMMKLQPVGQDTMLAPSADRQSIGFAEANNSGGPYGRILYRAVQVPPKPMQANRFLYDVAISRDGSQIAVPGRENLVIAGASAPILEEPEIISAAYHPLQDYLFVTQGGTSLISVYETAHFAKVKELDFGSRFNWTSSGYQTGRMKFSPDGKYIFCTVNGGVRYAETGW